VVQVVPFLEAGGKPLWWIFLLLLIIPGIIVWMAIAERRGKPSWVGILIIVPIMGIFVPAYLAFTD
jgi:type II secretory pathway component PulF